MKPEEMIEHRIYTVNLERSSRPWIVVFREYSGTMIFGYMMYSYRSGKLYSMEGSLSDILDIVTIRESTEEEIEYLRSIATLPPLEDYGHKL